MGFRGSSTSLVSSCRANSVSRDRSKKDAWYDVFGYQRFSERPTEKLLSPGIPYSRLSSLLSVLRNTAMRVIVWAEAGGKQREPRKGRYPSNVPHRSFDPATIIPIEFPFAFRAPGWMKRV